MTTTEAKRIILLAAVALVALSSVREIRRGDLPGPRVVIGAFGMAIILSLLAGPAPKVAGGLAAVLVTTSVMSERDSIEALAQLFNRK